MGEGVDNSGKAGGDARPTGDGRPGPEVRGTQGGGGAYALTAEPGGMSSGQLAYWLHHSGATPRMVSQVTIKNWRERGMPGVWDATLYKTGGWRYDPQACAAWVAANVGDGGRSHGGVRDGAGRGGVGGKSGLSRVEGVAGGDARPTDARPSSGGTQGAAGADELLAVLARDADEARKLEQIKTEEQRAAALGQYLPEALVTLVMSGMSITDPKLSPTIARLTKSQHDRLLSLVEFASAQLELAKEQGSLVGRDEVNTALRQFGEAVNGEIESLPVAVSSALVSMNLTPSAADAVALCVQRVVDAVRGRILRGLEVDGGMEAGGDARTAGGGAEGGGGA